MTVFGISFFLCILINIVNCIPVDNKVVGDPDVECGSESLTVNFNTQNAFEGHVYVKNYYNNHLCNTDGTNANSVYLKVPFADCGSRRQRSLNPPGMYVSATVIISFHPQFLTKVDRAYDIRCFYMEAEKSVTHSLQVSMLTTQVRTQNVPMPICRYEVLNGNKDGVPVRYATIGQGVYHKWTCDTETIDVFCMLVRSCYVDDGAYSDRFELLDHDGCMTDKHLLANLLYLTDLSAGQESHVFKYADKPTLYFQCQVSLFLKEGEQCVRPTCSTRYRRSNSNRTMNAYRQPEAAFIVDVAPGPITVIDIEDKQGNSILAGDASAGSETDIEDLVDWLAGRSNKKATEQSGRVCLSSSLFIVMIMMILLVFTVGFSLCIAFWCYRKRGAKVNAPVVRMYGDKR